MSESQVAERCVECDGALLGTAMGAQCPRCALGLAADSESQSESDLRDRRIGQFFPEYRILNPVGRGGFGSVYRAEHRQMKRPVAIKILESRLTRSAKIVARFEREMEVVGRLDHPGIVRAHDAGERDGLWFIVMEFVDGLTMGEIVRAGGPMAVADACKVIHDAALALEHAHGEGLIHRDVKPGNMMLTETGGMLKVLDFGLATMCSEDHASTLTLPGEFLGSVDYMAPELLRSPSTTDVRVDVYGLGASFYRLLSGTLPYGEGDEEETMFSKLLRLGTEPMVPIQERCPGLPDGLAAIMGRMLHVEPDRRPDSAAELAGLLAPFTTGAHLRTLIPRVRSGERREIGAATGSAMVSRPIRGVNRWGFAALVLAVCGLIGAGIATQRDHHRKEAMDPETPRIMHPLILTESRWRVEQIIESTEHVRFARFHPEAGVLVSDGVNTLELVGADGIRAVVSPGNVYNAVFLPGADAPLMVSDHGYQKVMRSEPDGWREVLSFAGSAARPAALAVVPAGWEGGLGLEAGDVIHTAGNDRGPGRIWKLRQGEEPMDITPAGAPQGMYDAAFSNHALYLAVTGGFLGQSETDAVWRWDGESFAPVEILPLLDELEPGHRGALCIACDRTTGDLYLACPPIERRDLTHGAKVFHLKRIDADGRTFKATLLVDGLKYVARYGLDLSVDGRRLAVVDDVDRRVYLLKRK